MCNLSTEFLPKWITLCVLRTLASCWNKQKFRCLFGLHFALILTIPHHSHCLLCFWICWVSNHRRWKVLTTGGHQWWCVHKHACTRGVWGHAPPEFFFLIRCSEIASEALFVLKFIFGLDAARILGPSVFGAPLIMFCSGPRDRWAITARVPATGYGQRRYNMVTSPKGLNVCGM